MPLFARLMAAGPRPALLSSFIVLAIIFGGGGSPSPLTELVLQLFFVVTALLWVWLAPSGRGGTQAADRGAWLLILLVASIPLVQLVPLPPGTWVHLPGRESQVAALDLVGAADSWRPLSLAPSRTIASMLALIPPLFVLYATSTLDIRGRRLVIAAVATAAMASALLGALQLAAGPAALRLYARATEGWITGFQANRNAEADLLLIGMLALAVTATRPLLRTGYERPLFAGPRFAWFAGALLLLLCAAVLTGSRAGISLIPVALAASWLIVRPALPPLPRRGAVRLSVAAIPVLGVAIWLVRENTALGQVASRFTRMDAMRPDIWEDTWFALTSYWPAGFGLGGFQPAIFAAERLEVLTPQFPNRAHNDYLELALEAGFVGTLALVAIAATAFSLGIRTWRQVPDARPQVIMATTALLIIALHSLVDYPLRSMALACLAGLVGGLLTRPVCTQTRADGQQNGGTAGDAILARSADRDRRCRRDSGVPDIAS